MLQLQDNWKQNWSKRSLVHGPALWGWTTSPHPCYPVSSYSREPMKFIFSPHPCYPVSGHSRQPMEFIFPEQSYSVICSPCLKCKSTELKVSEPGKGTLLCEMQVPFGYSCPVVPMAGFWSIKHTQHLLPCKLWHDCFLCDGSLSWLSALCLCSCNCSCPQTRRRPGEMEKWDGTTMSLAHHNHIPLHITIPLLAT